MKAKTKLTRLWGFLLALVMIVGMLPTTAFAAGSAETTDITEIKLTGNYQYGTVQAGILPSFNPGTTTDSITIDRTNSSWEYKMESGGWSGFGLETPVAYNDGKTDYGYSFAVDTKAGYQLASDLKVIYNGEDVTSTAKVSRWAWGAYVDVDLGKAIGENPTTHTVTFNSNGGTKIAPKEVVSGVKIKAPSTPTKDKYIFRGWYEDDTFSIPFDFNNTPITSDITLYAKWEAANSINEIRLAGDIQHGTVQVGTLPSFNPGTTTDSITIDKTNSGWMKRTSTTSLWGGFGLETPTAVNDGKTYYGYSFAVNTNDGYQLASDLKVIYNGDDVTTTANVSRWAWGAYVTVDLGKANGTPVVYTITFNSNDGTSVAPQNVNAGEKLTEPTPAPTKVGFTFVGWYEDSTFSKKFDFNTPITDSMTLYAKWTENKYTLTFDGNGGSGTMTPVTDLTGEYTLPANGFTAPAGKQFKAWSVGGVEKAVGDKITVTANTTVTAVWEAVEYNVTVTGGKATVGAGSEISKAAQGTTVTLTANAAPSGKVFDKWEVVSGGITLADANSATTTFTMPASAVSVKATYKNAPHTHTYNQETVKPEALKTPADCTGNAVYFKSCSCGAISTTDTFVAMNTALGHAYGSDWKYDSTNHWHECSRCHDKKYEAAHDYGSDNVCDTCGYAKTVTHTHNLTLVAAKAATCTTAGNSAYYTCDGCDKWFADATGSVEITDKTSVKIPAPGHTAGTEWKSDDTNHWHECTVAGCGVIIESTKSAHDYGSDNVCDTCGYYKTVPQPHTHNLTLVAAKAATCTEGGKEAYYKCEGCGKFYEDVLSTKEITDLASWGNIAKIAHTTKQTVTKATPTANGEIVNYCSVCKKTLSTTVIPNASSIKLKATSLTYNGKVRTPKVIVKDRTGKTLVKNTDYTVSYAKGRKYVGKYAVKITFKGKYSGTKTLYFTIKPKATRISSLKAGSKKFTVKWKKQATQTTGYQVQVATNKKFKKNKKTVTIKKQKTTKATVKKLKAKKKYYVRVRTYKTVKINGKSIRIYSGWSKAKTVTTKK